MLVSTLESFNTIFVGSGKSPPNSVKRDENLGTTTVSRTTIAPTPTTATKQGYRSDILAFRRTSSPRSR